MGAAEWMTAQGRSVEDTFFNKHDRSRPWLYRDEIDDLSDLLIGATITQMDIQRHSMTILFDNELDLTIAPDSVTRPIRQGSEEPRAFLQKDNLRIAVFLSPTPEIWI